MTQAVKACCADDGDLLVETRRIIFNRPILMNCMYSIPIQFGDTSDLLAPVAVLPRLSLSACGVRITCLIDFVAAMLIKCSQQIEFS